jgi:polyhydroxyalkanoate synthase subunit PhaC
MPSKPTQQHHRSSPAFERLDQKFHAALARATASISPTSLMLAFADWATHLATSPGRQMELARLACEHAAELSGYVGATRSASLHGTPRSAVAMPEQDRRFADPAWNQWPFDILKQAFLLNQQWWEAATRGVHGVAPHHEDVVAFAVRQWLDMFSPGNYLLTNPRVLKQTREEAGRNLQRGAVNLIEDAEALATGARPVGSERFVVGRDVAATPGKVVLRNRLVELIHYQPTTPTVYPEPVLIVPAWIMKYYVLDLSAHNSLIRYLVDQGHNVFCISWKNPGRDERDLGMDDYLELGFRAALDAVNGIVPKRKVHVAGYCLGGTLATIAAAAMARDGDDRLASLSLLASQTDFSEPGELALFIDDSQVAYLEDQMAESGYLTAAQMAGAFQMLRSYDLLWSRMVNDYLLGQRSAPNDLMAWNADATRMPARMHSQYLRRLYLDNDLANGRYQVAGATVALGDLRVPIFCVGTQTDHVAPWRSVYKIHRETPAEFTFVLTSGGHNAGIVSEPGHPHRHFQIQSSAAESLYEDPDAWIEQAPHKEGSWWPEWSAWLADRSAARAAPPRARHRSDLGAAPGRYVLER